METTETEAESPDHLAVSIVIPAFNEGAVIGGVIERIRELQPAAEVIVVDDGSTDNTTDVAEAAGALVIRQPYNKGNGAAVKAGIRRARGETIVLMDGDGQHDPEDIARLLEKMEDYELVVGARTRESEASFHRNLANSVYNRLASYMAAFHILDLTSGFRAIRGQIAKSFLYLLPNGFSYPTTITLAMIRCGFSVTYVPIVAARRVGKSKIRLIRDGIRFLLIIFRIATLFSPMRVFFPATLFFATFGIGLYAYRFLTIGRFTNMPALLLSTSVIVFMIGLLAEQISSLRLQRTF